MNRQPASDPELRRWSEDGAECPPLLRDCLSHARQDVGRPEQLRQAARTVAALTPLGALTAAGSAKAAASGAATLAEAARRVLSAAAYPAKWAKVHWVLAGALTSAGTYAVVQERVAVPVEPAAPASTGSVGSAEVTVETAAPSVSVTVTQRRPAPAASLAVERPSRATTPPILSAPRAAEPVAPEPTLSAPALPSAAAPAAPKGVTELQLLAEARAALSKAPKTALQLARRHQRDFPQGQLAQERDVILIEALGRLGENERAREQGREFEDKYPDSAHRRRVQESAKE
ncbi:MAG: hypothetical protein RJA70_1766 [Pseudomonadota bacterium]